MARAIYAVWCQLIVYQVSLHWPDLSWARDLAKIKMVDWVDRQLLWIDHWARLGWFRGLKQMVLTDIFQSLRN